MNGAATLQPPGTDASRKGGAANLTLAEAAIESRVSERTIRRGLKDARHPLRHYRIGRRIVIARVDLQTWLDAHAVATPTPLPPAVIDRLSPITRELLADMGMCSGSGVAIKPSAAEKARHYKAPATNQAARVQLGCEV